MQPLSHFSVIFPSLSDDDDKDDDGDGSSKRLRTAFTSTQLLELEREFAANMYLSRYVNISRMYTSQSFNKAEM